MAIERKKKKCKICKKEKFIFSRGRCKECSIIEYYKNEKENDAGVKNKRKKDYFGFFISVLKTYPAVDFETGDTIRYPSNKNCCHIFPKSIYRSISENVDNIIILSWENHALMDNLLFNMQFDKLKEKMPKTYNEIMDRVKVLMPLIVEKRGVMYLKIEELLKTEM